MQADIITIGDELLIGQVVDTNAAWLASQLSALGIPVRRILSIPDQQAPIFQALEDANKHAQLAILTGGLGPTKDDITKKTLAEFFHTPLVLNQEVLANVKRVIASKNGTMNRLNELQAEVPEKATVIQNPIGTAPVLWLESDQTVFVSLPGVPFEMKQAMESVVLPRIRKRFQTPAIVHRTVMTTGIAESVLAEKLEPWENKLPGFIRLAYLPSPGRIRLRLTATGKQREKLLKAIDKQIDLLNHFIPEAIFGFDEESLEEVVGRLLQKKNHTVSTAESCTAGGVARQLARVAGASAYFLGGVVSYSNQAKSNQLGVSPSLIESCGAVSQAVVEAMASGAQQAFESDYAIAISGIAGPSGGTHEKPVGTTWVAIATPEGVVSKHFLFGDNRERNMKRAAAAALNLLRLQLV